jgi:ankyrin repeat protein
VFNVGCWQARRGDVEVLSALIRRGANLEAPEENGDTALVVASRKADCDVTLTLLNHGAYVP